MRKYIFFFKEESYFYAQMIYHLLLIRYAILKIDISFSKTDRNI